MRNSSNKSVLLTLSGDARSPLAARSHCSDLTFLCLRWGWASGNRDSGMQGAVRCSILYNSQTLEQRTNSESSRKILKGEKIPLSLEPKAGDCDCSAGC